MRFVIQFYILKQEVNNKDIYLFTREITLNAISRRAHL